MAESLTIRQSQNDSGAILAARKTICFVLARAHRSDGKRFVVRADEKLTAFIELESAIRRRKAIATRHSAFAKALGVWNAMSLRIALIVPKNPEKT